MHLPRVVSPRSRLRQELGVRKPRPRQRQAPVSSRCSTTRSCAVKTATGAGNLQLLAPEMLGFSCCRPTGWGSPTAGGASEKLAISEAPEAPHEMRRQGAAPEQQWLEHRGGSHRILQPSSSFLLPSTELAKSLQSAPRSLLEASARRLAVSVSTSASAEDRGSGQAAGSALCLQFLAQYTEALKGSNPRWATQAPVRDMFAEDSALVTQDKKTFQGRDQVLRRLEKGVETIVKMAGKDAALPAVETSGPTFTARRTHLVKFTLRRGVTRLGISLEFTIRDDRIVLLRFAKL